MDYREVIEKGDYDAAIKAINGLLESRPEDPDLFFDLTCVHSLKGDVENALEALEEAAVKGYDVEYVRVEGGGHGNIDFSKPITEWLGKKGFRE